MAENFHDANNIKKKRSQSFMGSVKEITTVKAPPKAKETKVEPKTQAVAAAPAPKAAMPQPAEQPATEDKVTLEKGFVVGYTSDGVVKLQPFGGVGELELIGLVEYSKVKSGEVLGKIARAKTESLPAIEKGVIAIAQGIKSLLHSSEGPAAI